MKIRNAGPCWAELLVTGPWRTWVNDSPPRQEHLHCRALGWYKRLQTVTERYSHVNALHTKVLDRGRCRFAVFASRILAEATVPPGESAVPLSEKSLIQRVRRAAAARGESHGRGIGDDCAVLPIPRGHEALLTTDFSLEGVHFRREWHPPDSVGHRCLARGLSDIAAMGGIPRAAFLSLALPAELPQEWVDRFVAGLLKLAARFSVPLGRRRHRAIA